MPEQINTVKKITVGSESRFIAAKYDINGNEITTKYATKGAESDLSGYYTKTEADSTFLKEHQSLSGYYTKTEADAKFLQEHQSLSGYYTKTEIDEKFSTTGEDGNVYSKTEVDNTFLRKISTRNEDGEIVDEGADNYLKIRDAEDTYVKNEELEEKVGSTIQELITSGEIEIKINQNKKIQFIENESFISLSRRNHGRHILIKVFSSTVDEETGSFIFDAIRGNAIDALYWKAGASFEIYDKILFCTNSNGTVSTYLSTEDSWNTLELTAGQKISVMIYSEDWEDEEEGGSE